MGGKSGSAKMEVVDYYMSVHMGICLGLATLKAIIIGEKVAWEGTASTQQTISIDNKGLFGGNKKEGGVAGDVHFMPGSPPSAAPSMLENLARRLGLTSATCPAYSGIASLFFVGNVGATSGGFLWSSNSPYLKSVWAKIFRQSNTFPAKVGEPSNYANMGDNCNPAHMIYECLTNTEWGMGASSNAIDIASFQDCAKTFYTEGFGLSMMWTQQTTIEAFIGEIIDHIQATLFLNQQTGLLTLKAVRGDYNPILLAELNEDNCTVTKFQRKVWGETINEINVTWTNPANEQEENVTQHDLANIEMQGAVVSDTRNYYGVRSSELAMKVAVRDIRSAAAPLASFEIECNRKIFGVLPGTVMKLSYAEYGIEDIVVRINNVDYGRPGDSVIRLSAIEDIFSLPQSNYSVPGDTGWSDNSIEPAPLSAVKALTLPVYFALRLSNQYAIDNAEYPEAFIGVLGASTVRDTRSFELYGETVTATGAVEMANLGTKNVTARTTLQAAVAQQATSTLTFAQLGLANITVGAAPELNGFVFFGDGSDSQMEIGLISAIAIDFSSITIRRGVLDTTPKTWPAGTPIWFVNLTQNWGEETIYSDGQSVDLQATPSTSLGTLLLADAPMFTANVTGRPHYPQRPGNVKVGGVAFGAYYQHPSTANITVTWSTRNRLTEDSQVVLWDDGDVSPEAGQTTTVVVMDMDRNVITTHNGLAGSSFSLPYASFGGRTAGIVRVTSKRDGFESLQGHEIVVGFGAGYGMNYGNNYGDN